MIGPVESYSTDGDRHREIRKLDVTASTVAALFHVHPYATPLRLYVEKRGVEFPDDNENPVLTRGRWLEPSVGKAVGEKRPEWQIEPAGIYLRSPNLRLGATPDFIVRGDQRGIGILQVKSVAPHVFRRDWLDGDSVPRWIEIQNATEVLLAEEYFRLPCFGVIGLLTVDPFAMRCEIFEPPADMTLRSQILEQVANFWRDVELGREPVPDFEKDQEIIAARYPHEDPGAVCDLSNSNLVPDLLAKRAALMSRMKHDQIERDVIETEIKFLMRDAERVTGLPGWSITWKTEPRKGYTVEPSTPRVLRIRRKGEE